MAMRTGEGKAFRLAFAAVAALASVIAGCALAPRSSGAESPWPGRVMVLVASSEAASASAVLSPAIEALTEAGIGIPVSALGQELALSDFERVVTVPYLEAVRRLVPGDPRRDPWIEGLGRYFTVSSGGEVWQVVYVAASQAAVRRALEKALGPEGERTWMIAERGSARARYLWIIPAAFALLAAFHTRHRRTERLLGSLAWVPLWWMGGAPAAAVSLLAAFAGARASGLIPHVRRDRGRSAAVELAERLIRPLRAIGGPALAALILLAVVEPELIPVALLCALGQSAVFEAVAGLRARARTREGRKSFLPVPIVPSTRRKDRDAFAKLSPLLAALALAALPLSFLGKAGAGVAVPSGIPIPVSSGPAAGKSREPPLRSTLSPETAPERLPGLADAAAHVAFQRGVMLERLGDAVYGSGEPIVLQGFRRGAGGLVEAASAALVPVSDPAELRYSASSIETLLAEAGENAVARLEPMDGPGAPRRLAFFEILVYILAFAPFAAARGANLLARAVAEATAGKVREAA
ncbi:MAG TPA: hypothetical protein PKW82_04700 [Spirochaetales bacterium]|nr:hypothetical protein [Spirochaetales bacterium]